MSALVDRAIAQAGLAEIAAARRAGTLSPAQLDRLRGADLLALGALADRVRADEVGPEVRIHAGAGTDAEQGVVTLPGDAEDLTGLDLLRAVAVARLRSPRGTRIRVDFARCGLEIAQVALGFGADELAGQVQNKRGLPFAEGEMAGVGKKSRLVPAIESKRNELAEYVRRAGRTPVFVDGAFVEGP